MTFLVTVIVIPTNIIMLRMKANVFAVIKGYHGYKIKPEVGEVLDVRHEPGNVHDSEAMAVFNKEKKMVGHVPATPDHIRGKD